MYGEQGTPHKNVLYRQKKPYIVIVHKFSSWHLNMFCPTSSVQNGSVLKWRYIQNNLIYPDLESTNRISPEIPIPD